MVYAFSRNKNRWLRKGFQVSIYFDWFLLLLGRIWVVKVLLLNRRSWARRLPLEGLRLCLLLALQKGRLRSLLLFHCRKTRKGLKFVALQIGKATLLERINIFDNLDYFFGLRRIFRDLIVFFNSFIDVGARNGTFLHIHCLRAVFLNSQLCRSLANLAHFYFGGNFGIFLCDLLPDLLQFSIVISVYIFELLAIAVVFIGLLIFNFLVESFGGRSRVELLESDSCVGLLNQGDGCDYFVVDSFF